MPSPDKEYQKFLESKRILSEACGFDVRRDAISPMLFPFQSDIVLWALKRGKAAVFAHTGLGKGPIQMEWLQHVQRHTDSPVLLGAPLAVSQQFAVKEAPKFHVDVNVCQSQRDVKKAINITNYDRLDAFDLSSFTGVSLDESSIIKSFDGKTTKTLIEKLANTPFKLCSTATPSPNDHTELGTHAELLDAMTRSNMLAMFFEHDGSDTGKWALKGHAKKPFWRWVASWAVCLKKPSDLGYEDTDYNLPPLNLREHVVSVDLSEATEGMLFRVPDLSATGLHKELRLTCESRAKKAAEIVRSKPNTPWIIWVSTNYEADAMRAALPECVEVRGSDPQSKKEKVILQFLDGEVGDLLSKLEIFGFGLNLQHCCNMIFMGIGYSFERYFQGIRRCWRFGQVNEVNAHIVIAETEGPVLATIRRKESQYEELQEEMTAAMREEQLKQRAKKHKYEPTKTMKVPDWVKTELEEKSWATTTT